MSVTALGAAVLILLADQGASPSSGARDTIEVTAERNRQSTHCGTKPAPVAASRLEGIQWLAGCWWSGNERRVVEEQWMGGLGGLMLGMGRTTNRVDYRVIEYEQTMIAEQGESLVYTARPSGQPEATFTAIELTDSTVVFENAEHDFPQRVGYQLLPDGRLNAWIEGTKDGKVRHIDFPYQRVACQGSAR